MLHTAIFGGATTVRVYHWWYLLSAVHMLKYVCNFPEEYDGRDKNAQPLSDIIPTADTFAVRGESCCSSSLVVTANRVEYFMS